MNEVRLVCLPGRPGSETRACAEEKGEAAEEDEEDEENEEGAAIGLGFLGGAKRVQMHGL